MNNTKPNYIEFSASRLVAIYNTVNPIEEYRDFYLGLAKRLAASKIIDIGCGSGLLTCELAKQGYRMIGVEPSGEMLNLARQSPCGEKVKWIEGDALHLDEFNADLAIMTGHVAQFHLDDGYWINALEHIYRALHSGGYLAFESRNPLVQPWESKVNPGHLDWPSQEFPRKVNDSIAGEINWWMQLLEFKDGRALYENHYLFTKTGEELVSRNELRFRTKDELSKSLESAGFTVENVYGNWDGSFARTESPEFIFIAKRA